jgi:hypothetical protein
MTGLEQGKGATTTNRIQAETAPRDQASLPVQVPTEPVQIEQVRALTNFLSESLSGQDKIIFCHRELRWPVAGGTEIILEV